MVTCADCNSCQPGFEIVSSELPRGKSRCAVGRERGRQLYLYTASAMVAQISLCASSSPMCCRVTPVDVDLSAKEAGRPQERMPPPPERGEEAGSWAPLGALVYTAYAGAAVAYFYVRCAYTLDLGALRWCAPAWFYVAEACYALRSGLPQQV